jgi:iron complex transport system permease protein
MSADALPRPHRPAAFGWRGVLRSPPAFLALLALLLIVAILAAASIGAAGIPIERLFAAMGLSDGDAGLVARDRLILGSIRLPRIVLAVAVGAFLAVSGTIMQGLFRNPLADPGLVGVSAGGALAAAGAIVIGARLAAQHGFVLPFGVLPLAAFIGALATTALLYRTATR